jgi:tetratricopeptide (TPR) repeat protein
LLGALAAGAYVGSTVLWYRWRFQSALQAERARDFETAQRELTACLQHRPADGRAHLLAARLGWRSRLDELSPGTGWDLPLREHLKLAEADPLLIEQVTHEEQIIDALSGRLDAVAGALARRLKEGDTDEVPVLEALTWANIVLVRYPVATKAVAALISRHPDHARAHYWRGLIRELAQGADGPPDADYRQAVELAPGVLQFRLALARALSRHPNTCQEALGLFEELQAGNAHNQEVLAGLGRCRLDLGMARTALPVLQEAVEGAPDDGELLADLGRATLESGNAAAAEPILRRAIALAPNSRLPNYYLGLCLNQLGKAVDAKSFLDAATRILDDAQKIRELNRQLLHNPSPGAQERFALGELLCRTGQDRLGEYWLRSALDADPSYEPARKALEARHSSAR